MRLTNIEVCLKVYSQTCNFNSTKVIKGSNLFQY